MNKGKARLDPELQSFGLFPNERSGSQANSPAPRSPAPLKCPVYLPPLPAHVLSADQRRRGLLAGIRAVGAVLSAARDCDQAVQAEQFVAASENAKVLPFCESYLRFCGRRRFPRIADADTELEQSVEVAVISWFLKLAQYAFDASPAPSSERQLRHDLSARTLALSVPILTILDFAHRYIPSTMRVSTPESQLALKVVRALQIARPPEVLREELARVRATCIQLLNRTSTRIQAAEVQDLVHLVTVIADGLHAFAKLVHAQPELAFDFSYESDAFLVTLAAYYSLPRVALSPAASRSWSVFRSSVVGLTATIVAELAKAAQCESTHNEQWTSLFHLLSHMAFTSNTSLDIVEPLEDPPFLVKLAQAKDFVPLLSKCTQLCQEEQRLLNFFETWAARAPLSPSAELTDLSASHTAAHAQGESHGNDVEMTIKVSQLQDLFPEMPAAQAQSLVLRFHGKVEEAISAFFDNPNIVLEAPQQTKPSAARNIDLPSDRIRAKIQERVAAIDDFDLSRMHMGKSSRGAGHDVQVADIKARVLSFAEQDMMDSALDDEYDDTYDNVDAGVESSIDFASEGRLAESIPAQSQHDARLQSTMQKSQARKPPNNVDDPTRPFEELLYLQHQTRPHLFFRKAKDDRERVALRNRTGLSDQQIEGWASMLRRDPKRTAYLERKYGGLGVPVPNDCEPGEEKDGDSTNKQIPSARPSKSPKHPRRPDATSGPRRQAASGQNRGRGARAHAKSLK